MNDETKNKVEVIEPDLGTAQIFQQVQNISDDTMQQAREFMDEVKQDYEQEIADELKDVKTKYARYRMAEKDERSLILGQLSRQVLKVKSNAGMFGFELLTKLCELLFELLDDGKYDVNKARVEKTIELYINTLYIVYRNGLASNASEDAEKIVAELGKLNKALRTKE